MSKIAYVGITESHDGENLLSLERFYAFVSAVKAKNKLDSSILVHTPPFAELGYSSMKKILETSTPQAVYVSYDHLCPSVYQAISERGLKIPDDISVIGAVFRVRSSDKNEDYAFSARISLSLFPGRVRLAVVAQASCLCFSRASRPSSIKDWGLLHKVFFAMKFKSGIESAVHTAILFWINNCIISLKTINTSNHPRDDHA